MKQSLLLAGLVVLLLATLMLVITGYIRVLAVPVFLVFSSLRFLFDSLPQRLLWFGMLALAVPVAWQTLGLGVTTVQYASDEQLARGRVGEWLEALQNARDTGYEKWELAQQLKRLVLEVLSEQEGIPQKQVWRRLENGTLAIPPEVLTLLRSQRITSAVDNRRLRQQASIHERALAATIEYVEDSITRLTGEAP